MLSLFLEYILNWRFIYLNQIMILNIEIGYIKLNKGGKNVPKKQHFKLLA